MKINTIEETTAELFGPDDKHIGHITGVLQLNDIRIQVKKGSLEGYYIVWKDTILYIDIHGKLDEWPDGFFDIEDKQLHELLT